MRLHGLAAFSTAALLVSVSGNDPASADTCRALEMRMMQVQAGGDGRAARNMQALLVARGCRQGRPAVRAAVPERQARRPAQRSAKRGASSQASSGRTFRTLCVRSCDGYYFPVSYSTTRKHFRADASACAEMCPAADASLYVHRVGEGAESMVSLDGAPYTLLPSAFRYRLSYDPTCSCGTPGSDLVAAGFDIEAGATIGAAAAPSAPRPRAAPGEDPETAANRLGGFRPGEFEAADAATVEVGASSVRVVWPDRFSSTSDVLLSPVPN
jgi:hypothetical protein